jgi:OmpA-OmpF porin, OOP family
MRTLSIVVGATVLLLMAGMAKAGDSAEVPEQRLVVAAAMAPASPAARPAAEAPETAPAAPPATGGSREGAEPVPAAEPTHGHYKYCETLHIEFDVDRHEIRPLPAHHAELIKICDFMKKYPTTTAVIEGHTDNVGDPKYNVDLSQHRAEAVVDYLADKCCIDRSRLSAKGYGSKRPVADNATDAGRQKNRRIEAIIDCILPVKEVEPFERVCMHLVLDFAPGKAAVTPEQNSEIAKVADYMKQYPTTTAVIEGHTDNVGDPKVNMKLSQQRADIVMNYLVENFGIDRTRLSAKGYGSTRAIAYNDTAKGRAMNRRINAIIDCVIKH